MIFFTNHKNNTFNVLKTNASDRVLRTCWLFLLEKYGVTFEYLLGKRNVSAVADALSRLDIDSLKIQDSRRRSINISLRIRKQQHQSYQINDLNAYCLDLQRTRKSQGTKIKRKGLSPISLLNTTYCMI
jgi:hypothetical protein